MSTSYYYYCVDCNAEDFDASHHEPVHMAEVLEAFRYFDKFPYIVTSGDVFLTSFWSNFHFLDFLEIHHSHNVKIRKYDELLDHTQFLKKSDDRPAAPNQPPHSTY